MSEQENSSEHKSPVYMSPEMEPYQEKSGSTDHFQELLEQMQSEDVMIVLQASMQLSMDLSVAQEDTLSSFPTEHYIPVLIQGIQNEIIPDIGLYCILALNHLLDVFPNVASTVVSQGGVSALISKLGNFEYIDMAEHAISVLEKLSNEHAMPILKEGAFLCIVNLIDFFELNAQKHALNAITNAARAISDQATFLESILPLLPALVQCVQYKGQANLSINEKALEFFASLAENLSQLTIESEEESRTNFEILCEQDLIGSLASLLGNAPTLTGGIFHLLTTVCQFSAVNTRMFLESDAVNVIRNLLENLGSESTGAIVEVLHFTESILPSRTRDTPVEEQKAALYTENPQILQSLGEIMLPFIFKQSELFDKTVKDLWIEILEKLVSNLHEEFLAAFLSPAQFSALVGDLLSQSSSHLIKSGLLIIKAVNEKLPLHMNKAFEREGVIFQLENLCIYEKLESLQITRVPTRFRPGSKKELKMFLLTSGVPMDSPVFERLFGPKKKKKAAKKGKGGSDEEAETQERLPSLKKFFTTPPEFPDALEMAKNDIMGLAKATLEGLNYSQEVSTLQKKLEEITKKLVDGANDALDGLCDILNEEITSYELSNTSFIDALWKWICLPELSTLEEHKTESEVRNHSKRLCLFFRTMSKPFKTETYMHVLVRLFEQVLKLQLKIGAFSGENESPVSVFNLKSLTQKMRVKISYNADESLRLLGAHIEDYEQVHQFFAEVGYFTFHVDHFEPFHNLAKGISRMKSRNDLNNFKKSLELCELRGLSSAQQPEIIRQHDRLQALMAENSMTLEELKEHFQGNEELLQEITGMHHEEDEEEEDEEDLMKIVEEATPQERRISTVSLLDVGLYFQTERIPLDGRVFETLHRIAHKFNPDSVQQIEIRLGIRAEGSEIEPPATTNIKTDPGSIFSHIVEQSQDVGVPESNSIYSTLRVLKLIYLANSNQKLLLYLSKNKCEVAPIPSKNFISSKFSSILGRKLQDLFSVARNVIPQMIMALYVACPFLFEYNLRYEFLKSAGVGGTRAIYYFANKYQLGNLRMLRQKVSVPREKILEAATRIMRDPQIIKYGLLDIEYYNEEGIGLGPTLEFYSLLSSEIRNLPIWRKTADSGLFPAPIQSVDSTALDTFEFIGRLVAKSIYDDKMIDLPFSPAFWKLVFDQPLTILDLLAVDEDLGKQIIAMQEIANKRQYILNNSQINKEHKTRRLSNLTFNGMQIVDLCLVFTLPGYDDIDLRENGRNEEVALDNLELYCNLATQFTLGQAEQAKAFKTGFETVFPINSLQQMDPNELEYMICGSGEEKWSMEKLLDAVVPAHGYHDSSDAFKYLLEVMLSLESAEKRQFLQFVTGSPRLPLGGFKGLSPPLTVVRKDPAIRDANLNEYLPSVMTCQNYLKLPNYSSAEALGKQLRYAFSNASQSFHLS